MMRKEKHGLIAFILAFVMSLNMGMITFATENSQEISNIEDNLEKSCTWAGTIVEGNRAYYDAEGQKVTGVQVIGGKTYYFSEEGFIQTGWQTAGDVKYYFSLKTGERYENLTETIEGVKYSFDAQGIPTEVKNVLENSAGADESGNVSNSVNNNNVEINDENKQRIVSYSILDDVNQNDNSIQIRTVTGWKDTEEGKKYLDDAGVPVTGLQTIEGKMYYFSNEGVLQYGWIEDELNGNWYFANVAGILYKNQFITFGTTAYYMGADGSVQKGIIKASNGNIYYADEETGIIQKKAGWIEK
ncbi:hypothetical protein, partial [Faecalicatena contorta]|uniref:N-acetylmuramoyl-L-alanine amidase family protein n=1 Tax=Faecalicatena contorta TaxID=39482 RepID=UPI002F3EFC58|nr:hypothetical protein [Faecalicatena contorta]